MDQALGTAVFAGMIGVTFLKSFLPRYFLCDYEDFCPGAKTEEAKLNRASSTERQSGSWSSALTASSEFGYVYLWISTVYRRSYCKLFS
jgi:hypothetical protein